VEPLRSLLRPPNGTLEPPRKESAGTGGGHSSAFASCVEPLRSLLSRPNRTLETPRKESAGTGGGHSSAPQEKSLPAQVVATAARLQAVWSRCAAF